MKMRRILSLCLMILSFEAYAQKNYNMQGFELQLEPLMEEMFASNTDNERFSANEKFCDIMENALSFEKSFSYTFPKLARIKILTAPDKYFRILTWAIVSDEGDYENYGFVQAKNSVTGEYEVYRLFDRSDEAVQPEQDKLNDSTWFGAVYYDLITTKNEGTTYYTLLGWDGHNIYTRRKIIEPITFAKNTGRPSFGQSIFYKDKGRKRYIFEYSTDVAFTLRYGEQFYEYGGGKKAKSTALHKAQPFEVTAPQTEKKQMIFYDELEPMTGGLEGLNIYYVPSGEVTGLYFESGRWKKLKENVLPRNKATKKDAYDPSKTSHTSLFPKN